MKHQILITRAAAFAACVLGAGCLAAQTTLGDCYTAAEVHYPLIAQYGLTERARDYNLENAARSWWPQLQAEATAQLQSDVTELPFDLTRLGLSGVDVPQLSKSRYNATVSLTQRLYDGGDVAARRAAVRADADVNREQTATALYALREQVNQLYFGILLTQEQLRINALLQDNLNLNLSRTESMMQGGMAHDADLDAIRVELIKARQTADDYQSTRRAYTAMLAAMTGLALTDTTTLATPAEPMLPATAPAAGRPEMRGFDAQLRQVEASRRQLDAQLRPRLSLFAQGSYGRPGLNMFKNDFTFYGLAGLRLTWNISQLYTRKADKALLDARAEDVGIQRAAFVYRQGIDAAERGEQLHRYTALLRRDGEIISLRERIRRAAETKYAGGTMTATDLMRDINDEQQARLDRALHEMQRLLAAYNLRFTLGE